MMFTSMFGGAPHARVFDFLANGADRDHTIMEIARGAGVARPTVYKVVADFQEQGLVVETRTLGASRLFQLDVSDERVQGLLRAMRPAEFASFEIGQAKAPRRTSSRRSARQR